MPLENQAIPEQNKTDHIQAACGACPLLAICAAKRSTYELSGEDVIEKLGKQNHAEYMSKLETSPQEASAMLRPVSIEQEVVTIPANTLAEPEVITASEEMPDTEIKYISSITQKQPLVAIEDPTITLPKIVTIPEELMEPVDIEIKQPDVEIKPELEMKKSEPKMDVVISAPVTKSQIDSPVLPEIEPIISSPKPTIPEKKIVFEYKAKEPHSILAVPLFDLARMIPHLPFDESQGKRWNNRTEVKKDSSQEIQIVINSDKKPSVKISFQDLNPSKSKNADVKKEHKIKKRTLKKEESSSAKILKTDLKNTRLDSLLAPSPSGARENNKDRKKKMVIKRRDPIFKDSIIKIGRKTKGVIFNREDFIFDGKRSRRKVRQNIDNILPQKKENRTRKLKEKRAIKLTKKIRKGSITEVETKREGVIFSKRAMRKDIFEVSEVNKAEFKINLFFKKNEKIFQLLSEVVSIKIKTVKKEGRKQKTTTSKEKFNKFKKNEAGLIMILYLAHQIILFSNLIDTQTNAQTAAVSTTEDYNSNYDNIRDRNEAFQEINGVLMQKQNTNMHAVIKYILTIFFLINQVVF